MLAVAAQAPVPSQHCQESWVEAANMGWNLPGFNSKPAWVNTRLCPSLRLSFTQTTAFFTPVRAEQADFCLPGTGQGCAPPLAHKHPQHGDSLAPAPPAFVVRPLRMWETLLHFLSLLQKRQITSSYGWRAFSFLIQSGFTFNRPDRLSRLSFWLSRALSSLENKA